MKKMFSFLVLLGILSIVAVSCTKDQDTEAPEISGSKINGLDENIEIGAGTEMVITATFTDNEGLQQFKIDIHDAFDGHAHGKTEDYTMFSYQQVYSISGTMAQETQSIAVPENATAGPYHCVLTAIDAKGNESDFVELDLILTNTGQAMIEVVSPDFSQEMEAVKGEVLTLTGTITDNDDLVSVKIELGEEEEHGHGKTTESEPIYEMTFELPGNNDTTWDMNNAQILIPSNAASGHYILTMSAIDSDGNMSFKKGEVHID
ncbi:MAG: DUF4625 domain-containing protein [Sphingobacteriales bacterium]|nr:MAG: DUF4625 domain-containing protein [Sphingobacteriales bacterium]